MTSKKRLVAKHCTLTRGLRYAFAKTFVVLLMLITALGAKAYTNADIKDSKGNFNYCRETFEKITYEWTDEDGVVHVSNMAEPATEYRQICALLGAIYHNRDIPGLTQIYMEPNDRLYYQDGSTTIPRRVPYANNVVCEAPSGEIVPFGIPEATKPPYENTLTAVLIEVNSDPAVWGKEKDLHEVTSARVITSRKRISPEDSDNPGWIFNFDQPLGNFFLMTKGKARWARGVPTFKMYELYSPVNTTPSGANSVPTDTHERLLAGEAYPVLHDCARITAYNHHFSVFTKNSQAKHQHNMCIFIPDKRLTYWKYQDFDESHPLYDKMLICGDRDNTGGKNNPDNFTNYNPNFLPYILSYQIGLSSQIVKCDGHQYYALLEWKSNYKEVTKTPYHEEFMVYRVDNDGNMTPLEADEFILANDPDVPEGLFPEDTEIAAEGEEAVRYRDENDPRIIWSKADPVRVIVKEQQEESGKRVNYIVRGRPRIEDFSYTFSNTDYVLIPGFHDSFFIAVAANYHSDYTPGDTSNRYENNIILYAPDASEQPLLAQDMVVGRSFHLVRYANNDLATSQCIAEMDVVSISEDDDNNRIVYGYRINYYDFEPAEDGTLTRKPSTTRPSVEGSLYTDYVFNEAGERDEVAELDMHVLNTERPQEGYIATFTDILEENVVDNQHADLYTYYIVYNPSHIISFEDIKNHDDHHDDTMMTSNRVKVPVVKSDIAVNYLTYSSEEVAADVNREIPVSTVTSIDFSLSTNPRIQQYTVYESQDGGRQYNDIVIAEKSSTSADYLVQWIDHENNADNAIIVDETPDNVGPNSVKTVRLKVEDYDNYAVEGETDYERIYALSIETKPIGAKYTNTYGTYTARGPVIPTLETLSFDDVLLTEGEGADDPDTYDIGATIAFSYPENDDLAFVYSRPIYKIWRKIVPEGADPATCEQVLIYDDTNDEIGNDLNFTIKDDGSIEVWDQYTTQHLLNKAEAHYYVRQYSRIEDENVSDENAKAPAKKIRYAAASNSLSPSHRYIVTESTTIAPLAITTWGQILAVNPALAENVHLRYSKGMLEVPADVAVDIVNTQGRTVMRIGRSSEERSVSLDRLAKGLYIASSKDDVDPLKFVIR